MRIRLPIIVGLAGTLIWAVYGLLRPPGIFSDPAYGFMRWYHFLGGLPFDYFREVDPANIARDQALASGWWSPGQYVVPGVFTLIGLRLGTAIVLAVSLCLLVEIFGWLRFLQRFKFTPATALLFIFLVVTARYTTLNFRMYAGGEPLICAATPWIMLWAAEIPRMRAVRSFILGGAVVIIAFFAKLSGLIIALAALAAGSIIALRASRRPTTGMIFGAAGAATGFLILQIAWFSRQTIHHYDFQGPGFIYTSVHALYPFVAPLMAGMGLQEFLAWVFQNPGRPILTTPDVIVWIMFPLACVFAMFLAYNRRILPGGFASFALLVISMYSALMLWLYLRNAPIPLEERHYRPSGMLVLAALAAIATDKRPRSVPRLAALCLCGFVAAYGVASILHRPPTERTAAIEPFTRLRLDDIDEPAIRALQEAYAKHGRDALFVVPFPAVSLTLPIQARTIPTDVDFISETNLAGHRYAGRVTGPVYVVLQNRLTETPKRNLILRSFVDYDPSAWQTQRFSKVTMYIQQ